MGVFLLLKSAQCLKVARRGNIVRGYCSSSSAAQVVLKDVVV